MFRRANRILGLVLGILFLALGGFGFLVTGGLGFFAAQGNLFLGFISLNPAQNVLHILVGAALAMGALSNLRASSLVNAWTGAALLAIGLYGLFVIGSEANILSLNSAGNVLNFGAAAVLLAAGLGADQGVPATAGDVVDHA